MRYCSSGKRLSILGKSEISIRDSRGARTSEEGSGRTTNARVPEFDGIRRVRRRRFNILRTGRRRRLEFVGGETARYPTANGKIAREEDEGDGEEYAFSSSERLGMECQGKRGSV